MHRFQLALACWLAAEGQAFWQLGGVQCPHDAYQSSAVVLQCGAQTNQTVVRLKKAHTRSIASFPTGAREVSVELKSDVDFDLRLMDGSTDQCIVGFSCEFATGCANTSDYCISYRGMEVYYSGDDLSTPVTETIKIRKLTRPMVFSAYASKDGESTIEFRYGTIAPCPSLLPGCTPCEDYSCGADPDTTGTAPQCNGTAHVECIVPATGASTTTTTMPDVVKGGVSTTTTMPDGWKGGVSITTTTMPDVVRPGDSRTTTSPLPTTTSTMPGVVHEWGDKRTTTTPEPTTTATETAAIVADGPPCDTMAPGPPCPGPPCDTMAPLPPTTPSIPCSTLGPIPPTPGPIPASPCAVISPSVVAVASVGSAIIADPPEEADYAYSSRPPPYSALQSAAQLTKDGHANVWKQLVYNISAGTQEVTGVIRKGIVKGLEKAKKLFRKDGREMDHSLTKTGHEMDNTLSHIMHSMKPNLREGGQTQVMGKSQRTSDDPAARSQGEVPLAFGSNIATFFQSWCSPGSLCMMGLIGALIGLASLSSVRGCVVMRRTVAGYGQVSLPTALRAAASRSSREFNEFVTPCEDGESTSTGDIGSEGMSRVQLLEAGVEVE